MKRSLFILLLLVSASIYAQEKINTSVTSNRSIHFDNEWFFTTDSVSNAELTDYNDSKWRKIDLPHDWSIEDLPGPQTENQIGPFSKKSPGGWFTGFTMGGTGWYRKHFTMNKLDEGKLIKVLFDGVMTESDVWLNGKHLGYHPNGYTAFAYDLTPFLNPAGQPNILAVRANNSGRNSRWYSGSGIYRNVNLIVTNPLHIDLWGVYVTTPEVSKEKATVNISVKVRNETEKYADIKIEARIIGKNGRIAGQTEKSDKIAPKGNIESLQTVTINNPDLWSPDSPAMYRVEVDIKSKGKIVDSYILATGIRSIQWDAQYGLRINGKSVKLRGANIHHDNGILGAAAFGRAEARRIELLKANGFNAIRSSHYPPSTKFLEACDSLGIFVLDEAFDAWERIKVPGDYSKFFKTYWQQDLESMLLRDRNHPSVIIWSIGNEIMERADPSGLEIARKLISVIKKFDSTRPVTEAMNGFVAYFGGAHEWSYSAPAFALLDIGGYNYVWNEWENDHKDFPERIMMTTEYSTSDMYRLLIPTEKSPWIIGNFVWTGIDYLGETGCGDGNIDNEKVEYGIIIPGTNRGVGRAWPWFNAWCGDIDIIGNKKPQSYYRDVVWGRSQMEIAVHTPVPVGHKELVNNMGWPSELPCWTWPGEEGKTMEVSVYTHCTSVRLELNGNVIGEKKIVTDQGGPAPTVLVDKAVTQLVARFDVPYTPGVLKAIGIIDGKDVFTKTLKSAGAPKKLILTPDRRKIKADRNDLAYVTIEVADSNGNIIPNAALPVNFTITGNGELAAAGNGSPNQMASFHQPQCNTFRGKALIILRPIAKPGKITLTVNSNGLTSATVDIVTN